MPTVAAPVVAEAWRGGPSQASLARMLSGCEVDEMTADQARRVGELASRANLHDVVHVTVVEGAARRNDEVILTSNATHIRQVIEATGRRIRIETV